MATQSTPPNNIAGAAPQGEAATGFWAALAGPWKGTASNGVAELWTQMKRFGVTAADAAADAGNAVKNADVSSGKGLVGGVVKSTNNILANAAGFAAKLTSKPFKYAGSMLQNHQILSAIGIAWMVKKYFDYRQAKKIAAEDAAILRGASAFEAQAAEQAAAVNAVHAERFHDVPDYATNQPPNRYDSWGGYLTDRQSAEQSRYAGK